MLTVTSPRPIDRHIFPSYRPSPLPVLLTIPSPRPIDRHLSPFEGSPRAGAAEYVQGGMLSLQIVTSPRPIDRHIFLSC